MKQDLAVFVGHEIRRQSVTICHQLKAGCCRVSQLVTDCYRLKASGRELVTNCYQLKFFRCQNRQPVTICNRLKMATFNPISP